MKKMKTAYEIAMEKAAKLDDGLTPEEEKMIIQDELKPIMAEYYKEKIDAEELWQKLKGKDDETYYSQAQSLMLDSIGLRTTEQQLKRRKEGILAVESLKAEQNHSFIEQYLNQISELQQKYKTERERIRSMMEEAVENAEMQMKPVQTEDGRTVMKMEPSLNEEQQQRFKNALSELEANSSEMLTRLLDEMKNNL